MSTQDGKPAAAHHIPSGHDDITSGCNQTNSHQGGAAATPTIANKRDKSASGTSTGISQSFSQRVRSCRRASKRMITRDWFDQAVVGLILVNCIFLALDDPTMEASIRTLVHAYVFSWYESWFATLRVAVILVAQPSTFAFLLRSYVYCLYGDCMRLPVVRGNVYMCTWYVENTDTHVIAPS